MMKPKQTIEWNICQDQGYPKDKYLVLAWFHRGSGSQLRVAYFSEGKWTVVASGVELPAGAVFMWADVRGVMHFH